MSGYHRSALALKFKTATHNRFEFAHGQTEMINLRRTYLVASLLWALVLGPAVALGVFALGAGVSWLYLFGDDPWPATVEWLLPLIALCAGSMTAIAVLWFGYAHGRRLTASGAGTAYAEWRNAILLVIAPIVLLAFVALLIWARTSAYQEAMSITVAREAKFADFTARNQKIDSLRVVYDGDENLTATVSLSGSRDGPYRLAWRVSPSSFDTAIIADSRALELQQGQSQTEIRFSIGELRIQYQAEFLNGGAGVLVDELFVFDAFLQPLLSAEEIAELPPGEQRRLGSEDSPLASFASTNFPVYFLIP